MNITYIPAQEGDPAMVLDHDKREIVVIEDWGQFERESPAMAAECRSIMERPDYDDDYDNGNDTDFADNANA